MIKKIAEWPKCIESSTNKLEPHRIPTYLFELAALFHSYWNLGKDNPEKRFINNDNKITDDKLIFLKVISNVIKSGMNIVGVSVPEKCNVKRSQKSYIYCCNLSLYFFTLKYYFSDINKKKSFRSLNNIEERLNLYSEKIPVLDDDTKNIIEYIEQTNNKKRKNLTFGNY